MTQRIELDITGMTCDGCATAIKKSLETLPGISADVSYQKGEAIIDISDSAPVSKIIETVESAGFKAQERLIPDADSAGRNNGSGGKLHIAIIGSGSGAFAAAIKATENGARVTIIEKSTLGGTCVNIGCVPSKIMIRASQLAQFQRSNPFEGLVNSEPKLNRRAHVQQQNARVEELRQAKYQSILDSDPSITLIQGTAHFKDSNTLAIIHSYGTEEQLKADYILIATGASSTIPPIQGLSDSPYWTSTEALVAEEIPQRLIAIGSSVIALELAQAYRRLGTEVTILARHTLLYSEDPELGLGVTEAFESEGIKVLNNTQAQSVSYQENEFTLETDAGTLKSDRLLIATGRKPNTASLNLESVGVETDENGTIIVNERLSTSNSNIFAVGDCTNMPQYVYVAAAAGTRAAINMTGGSAQLNIDIMPAVVFIDPAVATVGLTEAEANAKGIETESRRLDLEHLPRALANFETRGFIKLVAEAGTLRIIGAQILAPEAGEIIQSAGLAIRNNMTAHDLSDLLFPYLTMVEGLKLCAQTFTKDVSKLSCCAG